MVVERWLRTRTSGAPTSTQTRAQGGRIHRSHAEIWSARVLGGCFMVDFRLFFYKTAGGHSSFVVTAVCLYQVI
ncbi:unnamed protein product [Ectocarpus sp. 8 AP-2014]